MTIPIRTQERVAVADQPDVCAACEVRSDALFGCLAARELQWIDHPIDRLRLPADAEIYPRGGRGEVVYTLRAGVVAFDRASGSGGRRIVRLVGRGDLFGQEALLGLPFGDTAVACTAVELCALPVALVEQLADRSNAFRRELMCRWQRALEDTESWAAELAAGSARQRMLNLLQRLGKHGSADGSIWLPRREEMSAMLDIRIETASRLVSSLRREGVIERLGARTARIHPPALQRASRAEEPA